MKHHVPGLGQSVGREEAGADAGIDRLEEDEFVHQVRVGASEALCPDRAEVMGGDAHLVAAEVLHESAQVFGEDVSRVALFRRQVRHLCVAEAAHIGDDDVEALS